jgi:signal peptidase I
MTFDFALVLVLLTFVSGIVWLIDSLFFAPKRPKPEESEESKEPIVVEYAKSFFPIFLLVLILRSFIIEPFKIPSGSMMPTLLIGDFILVNKYDYGIRLPVLNTKIIENGTPTRGDIVVFRYPENPSIPYIKRIIGLPGDHIAYYDKTVIINGRPIQQVVKGRYRASGSGKNMAGASLRIEVLDQVEHEILAIPNQFSREFQGIVPDNHYFVLGDNRDNSKDSRFWGYVPDANLMGRAFMIWMNWDSKNGGIDWKRIGRMMQ